MREAAKEAVKLADLLIIGGFAFEAHVGDEASTLGKLTILKAKMNPDLSMADELLKIPYAFRLSRATVRNIKVNLAISLAMKAAFVALAIAGVATLWMAIVADTGASVIVIANALRLLKAD